MILETLGIFCLVRGSLRRPYSLANAKGRRKKQVLRIAKPNTIEEVVG